MSMVLGHGRRLAPPVVALGDVTAMTGAMAGLGALLLVFAKIFTVLK
ncbi:MAG TPA: hypothetical protein VMA37_06695 [Acetobacteraceae bacterium]|nr:hypothetical protein [Acetobacteraceae bacterium]